MLDPDMPDQELRLHMGELSAQEMRAARAAIRWANSVADKRRKAELLQAAQWCEEAPPDGEFLAMAILAMRDRK